MYGTLQYMDSTLQYSIVQYSAAQYSTVQYSTVQYNAVQYSTVQWIRVDEEGAKCVVYNAPTSPNLSSF